jgi:hypothetical protein
MKAITYKMKIKNRRRRRRKKPKQWKKLEKLKEKGDIMRYNICQPPMPIIKASVVRIATSAAGIRRNKN